MQDALWDPERVGLVGSILTRYSTHLAAGHRIRMGLEGDPCSTYRSASEAPCATVLDVQREPTGMVRFRAQLDGSGAVVELDNRNVSPDRVWEIDPAFLDTFRGVVARARGDDDPDDDAPRADPIAEFRGAVDDELSSMRARVETLEQTGRELRETVASAVRELAGDLMRSARGEEPVFAGAYADRYDDVARRDDDAREEPPADVGERHQSEKSDFELSPPRDAGEDAYAAEDRYADAYAGGGRRSRGSEAASEPRSLQYRLSEDTAALTP